MDGARSNSGARCSQKDYVVRKRTPRRLPKRNNDIYANSKTNFKAQLKRCQKLLDTNYNVIYIHGLGVAMPIAINMALQIKAKGHGSIELSTHTSTVDLTDDIEPDDEEVEPVTRSRSSSAVHIKVYRPDVPLPATEDVPKPQPSKVKRHKKS